MMLVQLVDDVYTLPTSVVMLFRALQDNLSQKDVRAPHDCAGLKVGMLLFNIFPSQAYKAMEGGPVSLIINSSK